VGVDPFVLDGQAIREGLLELTSLGVAAIGTALFVVAIVLHRRLLARRSALPAFR
jgi:hypothetical protein